MSKPTNVADGASATTLSHTERRVAVNTTSRYAARFGGMVIGFLLTPYLLGQLGRELLGLHVLAQQVLQFVLLASGAIGAGYQRFAMVHYARREYDRMNRILTGGLLLSLGATAIAVGGAMLLAAFPEHLLGISPEHVGTARWVLLISGAGAAFGLMLRVWEAPVFVTQRFYLMEAANLAGRGLAAAAVILWFRCYGPSLVAWVALAAVSGPLLRLLFVVPACRRALPEMHVRLEPVAWHELRGLTAFSSLSFLGSLAFLLYYATDALLISNLNELGPAHIVAYDLGQRWDPTVRAGIAAFSATLVPTLTALAAQGDHAGVARTMLRGARYCVLLGTFPCVALSAFAPPFIRVWVGDAFVPQSAPVMRVLLLTLLLSFPGVMIWHALFGMGRLGKPVAATLVGGILNIILSIVLVKYAGLGLLGIALGTAVTLGLQHAIFMPFLAVSELDLRLVDYLRHGYWRVCLCGVPLAAVCAVLRAVHEPAGLAALMLELAVAAAVYAALAWGLGLTPADREKAGAMLRLLAAALSRRRRV